MKVERPNDLPDARLWMMNQWTRFGQFYLLVRIGEVRRKLILERFDAGERAPTPWHSPRDVHDETLQVENYCNWEYDTLSVASLYYVSSEMVDVWLSSSETIPEDVTVDDLEAPSSTGLVVLEKPWYGIDAAMTPDPEPDLPDDPGRIRIDAMLWGPSVLPPTPDRGPTYGLSISHYRHLLVGERKHRDVAYGAGGMNIGNISIGQWDGYVPLGKSDWPHDDALRVESYPGQNKKFYDSVREDRRVIAALFGLLQQEFIAHKQALPADRPTRRRTERAGLTREASNVCVVTLRKAHHESLSEEDHEGTPRNWSHRWIVRAHWRRQPCGPNRLQRRLTLVRAHVKGPDEKPLVIKQKVNALVR